MVGCPALCVLLSTLRLPQLVVQLVGIRRVVEEIASEAFRVAKKRWECRNGDILFRGYFGWGWEGRGG